VEAPPSQSRKAGGTLGASGGQRCAAGNGNRNSRIVMNIEKTEILNRICYTELVYERINKKLESKFSKSEIEKKLFDIVKETQEIFFQRIGKNIYVTSQARDIKITINSNTYRIITVDKLNKVP
jgi:hypothetical protein